MLRKYLLQLIQSSNYSKQHSSPVMDNEFIALVNTRLDSLTKLERRIAAYLLANPTALLVDTSGTIAERAYVSPMTVTRFFKKLGFDSAAAAKDALKQEVYGSELRTIGKRFDDFQRSRADASHDEHYQAAAAATSRACEVSQEPIWREIISLVAHADSVYATGFQTMGYLANGLVQRLGYVRANVHELDGTDGVYAKLLTDPAPKRTLIIIDTFRYGRNGPVLAKAARDRGADVVIFCDELCDWAAPITPYVVALPSEAGFFFRPTTAIYFSLNLLIQDVIDELGDSVREQMKLLSQAQELFGQYMK
jgi:DNA-binding MurR/RpiR family transcriptional regulator